MATGPEHYRDAERNLEYAKNKDPGSDGERFHLAAAQVHAALAVAAATAWFDDGLDEAWRQAAGSPPEVPQ